MSAIAGAPLTADLSFDGDRVQFTTFFAEICNLFHRFEVVHLIMTAVQVQLYYRDYPETMEEYLLPVPEGQDPMDPRTIKPRAVMPAEHAENAPAGAVARHKRATDAFEKEKTNLRSTQVQLVAALSVSVRVAISATGTAAAVPLLAASTIFNRLIENYGTLNPADIKKLQEESKAWDKSQDVPANLDRRNAANAQLSDNEYPVADNVRRDELEAIMKRSGYGQSLTNWLSRVAKGPGRTYAGLETEFRSAFTDGSGELTTTAALSTHYAKASTSEPSHDDLLKMYRKGKLQEEREESHKGNRSSGGGPSAGKTRSPIPKVAADGSPKKHWCSQCRWSAHEHADCPHKGKPDWKAKLTRDQHEERAASNFKRSGGTTVA